MDNHGKTVGILAYCTLIGYIIAWVMHSNEKTKFGAFHLRQATGLLACGVALMMLSFIFGFIPGLRWIFALLVMPAVGIAILVFAILGIVAAANEEEKEVPVVGKFFSEIFKGIE